MSYYLQLEIMLIDIFWERFTLPERFILINYANLIWGQKFSALIIVKFQSRHSHYNPLFKSNYILKFEDKILLDNILSLIFNGWFTFYSDIGNYQTASPSTVKYLNHHAELILIKKVQSLQVSLIVWIKLNISSLVCYWKQIAQLKWKIYSLKNTSTNINEENRGIN